MKKIIAAALLTAACAPAGKEISQEDVAQAARGARVIAWDVVELRPGTKSVFVLSEYNGRHGVRLLEDYKGKLSGVYGSPSWGGREADSVSVTDMGNDGKKEVEVRLTDGRRIYCIWDGKQYRQSPMYEVIAGPGAIYSDLDGDGTEEAVAIYANESSTPFSKHEIFSAYKWRHEWVRFEDRNMASLRQEYEKFAGSGMDALALDEKRLEIAGKLRSYVLR